MDIVIMNEMLKSSISEVFETMFFIFLEEENKEGRLLLHTDPGMCAKIPFQGIEILLVLSCSRGLLHIMNNNIFGYKKIPDDDALLDLLKEATNVVAGMLATKIGNSEKISLGIPTAKVLKDFTEKEDSNTLSRAFYQYKWDWLEASLISTKIGKEE